MSGTWASGWISGDIVTAAEFKKGAGAIADQTLGGSAANIDVTGIISGYAHLLVIAYLRGDTAATATSGLMRFNNDSGANYDWERISSAGATTTSAEGIAQTALYISEILASTATAAYFSTHTIFIPNYAGTVGSKPMTCSGFYSTSNASGAQVLTNTSGKWRTTATAISRLTILPTAGNLVAGSRVTVYGLGA